MTTKTLKTSDRPIGILARFVPGHSKPLGKQTHLIQGFFNAAISIGRTMAVFHPDDLLTDSRPHGWFFRDGEWRDARFRLPCVLYDRLYSTLSGPDRKMQVQKRQLETERKIVFMNPMPMAETATDKLAFGGFLREQKIASPAIIEKSIPKPGCLWGHIFEHGSLIIKPRYGRMGKGIMRFSKSNTGVLFHSDTGRLIAENPWHLAGMIEAIMRSSGLTHRHFILQECISMPENAPRYFDIRVLVQRISGSEPARIAGEVARVGSAGVHVPNIDFGGLAMPLPGWLNRVFGHQATRLHEALRETAITVFQCVESTFGKTGELGLDMLIDGNGKIWVIEANSKPGRIAFERLASGFGLDPDARRDFALQRKNSILNPVVYCAWLMDREGVNS